ncbi:hypothetical protein [Neorhodopirellula pilleata]|uniref:HD domain-containing protein n=1 Tax=Neorhodopirellula pilleata TaxID=2714738 RepID=A0A5C5ZWZ4_9BACT|nr:hypothetical protein [Neorhodopirellula pilleata]TWT91646.1 hypothetical protein Pla100_50380 [Neorhodopirellula pilleata]
MTNYEEILNCIQSEPAYQANLEWGKPRSGHPEGSIRQHIMELEHNLGRLRPKLSDDEFWKLRVLIHTHDTFKPDASSGVAIVDPNSHASLARKFLERYVKDRDLLTIVQFHDEPFALWKKYRYGGDHSERKRQLLEVIDDWDLLLAFLIVDGCTAGKSTEPLEWFFAEIEHEVESKVDATWIQIAANHGLGSES